MEWKMGQQINPVVAKSIIRMNLQAAAEIRKNIGFGVFMLSNKEREHRYWEAMELADQLRQNLNQHRVH